MTSWERHHPIITNIPDLDEQDIKACSCGGKPDIEDHGRAWFASHLEALGAPDYMHGYWRFWSAIVERTDDGLDRDQVARELHDYNVVMTEASKVYEDLAGFSKPNTAAHHVIAGAEERFNEIQADLILHDLLPLIEGDANRQTVIDYAEGLHGGAWEDHQQSQARLAEARAQSEKERAHV